MKQTPEQKAWEALHGMEEAQTFTPKDSDFHQDWAAYNKVQRREKKLFLELFAGLTDSIQEEQTGRGRPRTSLSTILFSSCVHIYGKSSLRRAESMLEVAKDLGYIDKTCSYATFSDHMQKEDLTNELHRLIQLTSSIFYEVETKFSVDGTGFSTSRFERYYDWKHGDEKTQRKWKKAHLMSGVKTNIVTAARISDGNRHDSPFFEDLVEQTSELFDIEEVSADKAYNARYHYDLVEYKGGEAFTPFKSNTKENARKSKAWKRMYHKFKMRNGEFRKHYHNRSNAETVFHMMKSKFGDSLDAKKDQSMRNELLFKVLCHNICVVIQEMHKIGFDSNFGAEGGDSQ